MKLENYVASIEDFPMEGIELAIKLAENEVVVSDYGA